MVLLTAQGVKEVFQCQVRTYKRRCVQVDAGRDEVSAASGSSQGLPSSARTQHTARVQEPRVPGQELVSSPCSLQAGFLGIMGTAWV